MKLYEIADEIERALADPEIMDPESGELLDEEKLNHLQMALDRKVLAVARYILGEEREAEAVHVEVERLAKRARAHANRAKRLREYLGRTLARGDKFKDSVVSVSIGESYSVDVYDEARVPKSYWVQKPAPAPVINKVTALREMKAGTEIDGLRLAAKPKVTVR